MLCQERFHALDGRLVACPASRDDLADAVEGGSGVRSQAQDWHLASPGAVEDRPSGGVSARDDQTADAGGQPRRRVPIPSCRRPVIGGLRPNRCVPGVSGSAGIEAGSW